MERIRDWPLTVILSARCYSETSLPPLPPSPEFCDVALPVPLHSTFTYRLNGAEPVVGGRVLVPFGRERLPGVVVGLHDQPPPVPAKNILRVLDEEAALDDGLMKLAAWMADYYLAPLGEVLRGMLPLQAEVKRVWEFRIAPAGEAALHDSARQGSSRRSRQPVQHQMTEYAVLNFLASHRVPGPATGAGDAEPPDVGRPVRKSTLRSATGASEEVLRGMLRKKWITREDVSTVRDLRRMQKIAVLSAATTAGQKLNPNQKTIVDMLLAGRLPVDQLRALAIPPSTLQTLVRRGLVEIITEPAPPPAPGPLAKVPESVLACTLLWDSSSTPGRKKPCRKFASPSRRKNFPWRYCMASPARARPRSILRQCSR